MVISIGPELEAVLIEQARRQGTTPDALAVSVLREGLMAKAITLPSQDDWERRLRSLAKNCGVSLSNTAVSSEGLYD